MVKLEVATVVEVLSVPLGSAIVKLDLARWLQVVVAAPTSAGVGPMLAGGFAMDKIADLVSLQWSSMALAVAAVLQCTIELPGSMWMSRSAVLAALLL